MKIHVHPNQTLFHYLKHFRKYMLSKMDINIAKGNPLKQKNSMSNIRPELFKIKNLQLLSMYI